MDFRIICYIIFTIIYIKLLTVHGWQHVPSLEVTENVNEDVKKLKVNIDTEVKENTKALYYLLKADQLNDNLLDRLVEKLILIQPKPPKFEPYNFNDGNKKDKPTRRSEWLDKAKFAIKSMPKYENFIGEELAGDYKRMSYKVFGVNTKDPSHSDNNTPTEKYLATKLKNKMPVDIELGNAKNEEISNSTAKLNNEMTKPSNANRRFEVVEEVNRLDVENDNKTNSQESVHIKVLNDTDSEDNSYMLYNNDEFPEDQHCKSDMVYNNRRSENIHEKEKLTVDNKVKNETNTDNVEAIPPIIKLLKNAWANVMRDNAAKLARKKALADKLKSESNVKDGNKKKNQTVSNVEKVDGLSNVYKVADVQAKVENQTDNKVDKVADVQAKVDNQTINKVADVQAKVDNQTHNKVDKVADVQGKVKNKTDNKVHKVDDVQAKVKNQTDNKVDKVADVQAKVDNQTHNNVHKLDDIGVIDKGFAPKQNRRLLTEDNSEVNINNSDEKPNSVVDANNLWCSTGLLCRKNRVPVCGLDVHVGYARFEDICQLLLVNCYYNHQFIPAESCDHVDLHLADLIAYAEEPKHSL